MRLNLVKFLACLLSCQFVVAQPVSQNSEMAKAEVMSFQTWKNQRIEEARSNLEKIKAEVAIIESVNSAQNPQNPSPTVKAANNTRGFKSITPEKRVEKATQDFEMIKDFNISDYIILYVDQLKNKEMMVQAAKKLTPDDVAELMLAYRNKLLPPSSTTAELVRVNQANPPATKQ